MRGGCWAEPERGASGAVSVFDDVVGGGREGLDRGAFGSQVGPVHGYGRFRLALGR